MVFRNLSPFVIMNGGGGGVDRSLHFVCALPPRRPLRPARTMPCSKVHRTFSLTVTPFEFDSCHSFVREKKRTTAFYAVVLFFLMVEVARVELASESISKGLSPSAVNVLEFRLDQRPLTGYGLSYPVSPL